MVRAASGSNRSGPPGGRTRQTQFGVEDRLSSLEQELAKTRAELADEQSTSRRYNLLEGAGEAVAGESVADTKAKAAKLLAEMQASGKDQGDQYNRVAQIAETGSPYKGKSFLGYVGGLLDIPVRTLRAGVLDFTGLDEEIGQEIDFSDSFKDILLQRDSSLRARNSAFSDDSGKWSDSAFNMSKIMEELGYEKADTAFGKVVRGAAQFGLEMIDPINAVTGGLGGVGKGVARGAARGILNEGLEGLVRSTLRGAGRETKDAIEDRIVTAATKHSSRLDEARDAAAAKGLRGDELLEAQEAAYKQIVEEVRNEVEAEVMKPLLARDFANMPEWFAKSERVARQAPYLQGGLRPTLNPFGSGLKGAKPIPGTIGAGRRMSRFVLGTRPGTEARGALGRTANPDTGSGLAGLLAKGGRLNFADGLLNKIDNSRPVWKLAATGDPQAQQWARTLEGGLAKVKADMGTRDLETAVNQVAKQWSDSMGSLDPERRLELDHAFLEGIQQGVFRGAEIEEAAQHLPRWLDDAQRQQTVEFAKAFDSTMRKMRQKATSVGMDLGNQENYVPFIWNKQFNHVIDALAEEGPGINPDEAPEALRAGLAWLSEAIAARQRRTGGTLTAVGESAHAQQRMMGRDVKIRDINGITMLDGAADADLTFATHGEMNEAIAGAVKWLQKQKNLKIPKFDDALDMDPASVMNRYLRSMADAVHERALIQDLRSVGAIRPGSFSQDIGRVVAQIVEDVRGVANRGKLTNRVNRIERELAELSEEFENPMKATKNVSLGAHGKVALPARAVDARDPRLIRHIDEAKRKAAAYRAASSSLERAEDAAVKRLTAKGVDETTARAIAGSRSRQELKDVARRAKQLALEDATEEVESLWEVARRVDLARSEVEGAVKAANRAAARSRRAVERTADDARRKLHREVANEMRGRRTAAFPPVRFDDPAARESLIATLRQDISSALDDLEFDLDAEAGEIFGALKEALNSGEGVGEALQEALAVGRRKYAEVTTEIPDGQLDGLRGLALETIDELSDLDLIDGTVARQLRNSPVRPGGEGETLWKQLRDREAELSRVYSQTWQANRDKMTPGIRNYLARMEDALGNISRITGAMEESISAVPSHWQLARQLQGHDLFGEMHALRKLALGQKIMSDADARMGLERMLWRAGMIGDEIEFAANPQARLGFELLDRSDRWAPISEALNDARKHGLERLEDALAIPATRDTKFDDWEMLARGLEVPANPIGRGEGALDALFPADRAAGRVTMVVGDAVREVADSGEVAWTVRTKNGDALGWAIVDPERGVSVGVKRAAVDHLVGDEPIADHLLRLAKQHGDVPPGGVLDREGAAKLWNKLRAVDENIAGDTRRTLDQVGELPDYVRRIEAVEDGVRDAFRRINADPTLRGTQAASEIIARQAEILGKLRERVLRPLNKKTATKAELDSAVRSWRAIRAQIDEVAAPLDRVNLDLLDDHINKVAVLQDLADSPEARRLIDSANNLRTTYFDPETTVESLRKTAAGVQAEVLETMTLEQVQSAEMVRTMNEVLRRMLAVGMDEDGNMRRGFLTAAEEQQMESLMDQGRRAWRALDLPESEHPFHIQVTPTSAREGFLAPTKFGLGGQLDTNEVVDRFAGAWLENTLAVMGSAYLPENMNAFARNGRLIMNWWKAAATVARPSFHIRNVLGGLWNGQYADVRMRDYKFAIQNTTSFLRALRKTRSVDDALAELPEAARTYYRAAWDVGIFDDTFAASEILARDLSRKSKLQTRNPFSIEGPVTRAGGETMQSLEGNMRMAAFARWFDPDASDLEVSARWARNMVDMVHFNYSDLTKMEQSIKRFVPFFVWFRRNLPLQMRMLTENPRMIQRYEAFISAVDGQTDDMPGDDLPYSIYRQGTAFAEIGAVNEDTPFWSRMIFDPDLPINIFDDVTINPMSWLSVMANQLGPQFDVINNMRDSGDGYSVTAPGGIDQLIGLLPGDNPYNVTRLDNTASALMRLALPQFEELGGFAFEQDATRRQKLGQTPVPTVDGDDSLGSDLMAGLRRTVGRGLGVQLEGVDTAYGTSVGASFDLDAMRSEMRKTGQITPEAEEAVANADAEMEQQLKLKELQKYLDSL